jgi:hypothetical protein
MLKACCRIRQPSAARIGVRQNTRNCWEFRDESHRAVDWARGVLAAKVEPQQGLIAFVKDGSIGAEDGQCMVRMLRSSGSGWVECGGSMVTLLASTGATGPGRNRQDEARKAQLSQR